VVFVRQLFVGFESVRYYPGVWWSQSEGRRKMLVKLIVRTGAQAGKELKIPAPHCLIGRSEECHLRPQIEAISRRHCMIVTTENEVVVRDLQSRNGTFVNGEQVKEESVLLTGDVLRVGPIEFEALIEQKASKPKQTAVKDIKEAVVRTAAGGTDDADPGDVSQWLTDADEEERQKRMATPETRQFRVDDTAHKIQLGGAAAPPPEVEEAATEEVKPGSGEDTKIGASATDQTKAMPARPQKKPPGKLPPRPAVQTNNSREAAADVLKKFFNRR
jgi:pSer/pThr/pTyr-binding forkhead associated (FHA) protein